MAIKVARKKTSRLYVGSAYYPEQWPESEWKKDIRLMAEAGFNVARLGEFAWSTLEPGPGDIHFGWLQSAIAQLARAGIQTVLGTPTAAPPAWLVTRYPDILALDETGRRVQFGNRCHYCVNSPDYHEAVRRLISRMAEAFGKHPNVIGWQIDNEFNRYCYCPHCEQLFHEFLAQRYGTLDELNRRWTTAYWSQAYDAWEQIPLPVGPHNPGLMLEFKHFMTLSYRRFQRLQIDALRPHLKKNVWISHNFMYWHDGYDHYEMSEDLDIASWDWYVGMGHVDPLSHGAAHDLVRGYKRQNFWLMETQPGNVNWRPVNNVLNKGEARTMAWHAVGHGADALLYWQWRSPLNGQEQYHGTLLDQSGQPRLFYSEAKQVAQDFASISSLLAGSTIQTETAILHDYDSRWSIRWQPHHQDFDYVEHLHHYYRPLAALNIPVDIVSADASLKSYQLIIAPALLILNDRRVTNLNAFVKNGGHLVLTIRSGMKDEFNALLPMRQPGKLSKLTGVEVEEYYALDEGVSVIGEGWEGRSTLWAERLKVLDEAETKVLARYGSSNGWLDQQPAITQHAYGKGMVTFVGAYLEKEQQKLLLEKLREQSGVKPVMKTNAGVEACRRITADQREVFILINHTRSEQMIQLPWPAAYEHLQGTQVGSSLALPPYGIAVLTLPTQG